MTKKTYSYWSKWKGSEETMTADEKLEYSAGFVMVGVVILFLLIFGAW